MNIHHYADLRAANFARNTEWTSGQEITDYTWRATELAGEVGEVCNLLGSGAWNKREELAEELADGVICIDLVRSMFPALGHLSIFSQGSYPIGADAARWMLASPAMDLCNVLKKLERERRGWPGGRGNLAEVDRLTINLMGKLGNVADYHRINLALATATKFNLTSIKVGLETRLSFRSDMPDALYTVPVSMAAAIN